jgi:hypothetical protein
MKRKEKKTCISSRGLDERPLRSVAGVAAPKVGLRASADGVAPFPIEQGKELNLTFQSQFSLTLVTRDMFAHLRHERRRQKTSRQNNALSPSREPEMLRKKIEPSVPKPTSSRRHGSRDAGDPYLYRGSREMDATLCKQPCANGCEKASICAPSMLHFWSGVRRGVCIIAARC